MQVLSALAHHNISIHVELQKVAERHFEAPYFDQLFSDYSELIHEIWSDLDKVYTVRVGVDGSPSFWESKRLQLLKVILTQDA